MNCRYAIAAGLSLLLLYACQKTKEETVPSSELAGRQESIIATKVLNPSEDSSEDRILIYLDTFPSETTLEKLRSKGIRSVVPLFTSTPGKEEMEKRFELDKWYIAFLQEGVPYVRAAQESALLTEVEAVSYDNIFRPHHVGEGVPYHQDPQTKATTSDYPFNDPSLSDQWNYINKGATEVSSHAYRGGDLNLKDVWENLTAGDPSIIVGVVDEAVKYTHPDLAANMWSDDAGNHGFNFVTNSTNLQWGRENDSGHGTHVAGTISAVNNNGTGVCGVAGGSGKGDGVKIMSCQVYDNTTGAGAAVTANAIKYAADHGASVINCSFGYHAGTFTTDNQYKAHAGPELQALRYFESMAGNNDVLTDGNIAIFSGGNDGDDVAGYPGALAEIIAVSALGPDFLPAYYTCYGAGCNIAAPGGEAHHKTASGAWSSKSMILSTVPSESYNGANYGYMQGTSMAAPHVTGVVALALSYAHKLGKKFTVQEFKNMIISSAIDLDSRLTGTKDWIYSGPVQLGKYRHQMGTGAIDTWTLMMQIEGIPSTLVKCGEPDQWVDISPYFGSASVSLTYLDVQVLGNGKESMGFTEDPYVKYGRLFINPTKVGSCKIKITAVGGGSALGGGDNPTGGMEVSQEISIISRNTVSKTGGWL